MPAAPTPVYIAQRVGGPPTMDRLGAPDQGAIQREKGPSRWVGPEINPTGRAHRVAPRGLGAPLVPEALRQAAAVSARSGGWA